VKIYLLYFLDILILSARDNPDLGYTGINQTIAGTYLGAGDTVKTTLRWLVLNLANNEMSQERCYNEIEKSIELYGTIKRGECHFLESFLLENMRAFPIADTVPHRVYKDIIVEGFRIPNGSIIQGCNLF